MAEWSGISQMFWWIINCICFNTAGVRVWENYSSFHLSWKLNCVVTGQWRKWRSKRGGFKWKHRLLTNEMTDWSKLWWERWGCNESHVSLGLETPENLQMPPYSIYKQRFQLKKGNSTIESRQKTCSWGDGWSKRLVAADVVAASFRNEDECTFGTRQEWNYAAKKDAHIELGREAYALDMELLKYTLMWQKKDVQNMLSAEECPEDMVQRPNWR